MQTYKCCLEVDSFDSYLHCLSCSFSLSCYLSLTCLSLLFPVCFLFSLTLFIMNHILVHHMDGNISRRAQVYVLPVLYFSPFSCCLLAIGIRQGSAFKGSTCQLLDCNTFGSRTTTLSRRHPCVDADTKNSEAVVIRPRYAHA